MFNPSGQALATRFGNTFVQPVPNLPSTETTTSADTQGRPVLELFPETAPASTPATTPATPASTPDTSTPAAKDAPVLTILPGSTITPTTPPATAPKKVPWMLIGGAAAFIATLYIVTRD